jgi:UDP-N-acetylglucosamine--N-acetylmuramyl-(pentapeptide) pyrophosphoryl-undecaprenol N-acetylglucosamine transferase
MPANKLFLMAGGGTGGHVIPALAVARELRSRGHEAFFVGTERGVEARIVPPAGFQLEMIRIGGIKNLGPLRKMISVFQLVGSTARQLFQRRPTAVFSMGGYVAGPPVLAALLRNIPVVVMEPNAVPGVTNRWIGRFVHRALLSFPETARFFPAGRTEITGLPVREDFFRIKPRERDAWFTVLITGGSQGSRTLNEAAKASWPLFRKGQAPVRLIHQTGLPMFEEIRREFASAGVEGEVSAFIQDMPAAFSQADLIVCRAGAGAVAELAAAGKPSVLIPFPFAADDHQLKNAEAFQQAGASLLFVDREWTGEKLYEMVMELWKSAERLDEMGRKARALAHEGAAQRAAEILEEIN